MRWLAGIVGVAVLAVASSARARRACAETTPPDPPLGWHADAAATVSAEHDTASTVLAATSTARLSLGAAASRLTFGGTVDLHRPPALAARRELTARRSPAPSSPSTATAA